MIPTRARLAALALVAVASLAATGRAQDPPADDGSAAVDELALARAELDAERALVEDRLGALSATHASVQRTLEWLGGRLDGLDAAAEAALLTERHTDLRRRRRDLAADLVTLRDEVSGFDAARAALLQQDVRLAGLLDMAEAARLMATRLDPVERRGDGLVRDTVTLNVDVERAWRAKAPAPAAPEQDAPAVPPAWLADEPVVELVTSEGSLVLELRPDVAPRHVENFRRLVLDGFYDGLTLHRVVPGYLVQGGDPLGTGMGGPGWQIRNEFNRLPHHRGTLSMARMAQWDTAGSQFFLCLDDWSDELDGKYTVFGRLLRG